MHFKLNSIIFWTLIFFNRILSGINQTSQYKITNQLYVKNWLLKSQIDSNIHIQGYN